MRFACLTGVAPGADLAAQCASIAAAGCTGVETLLFPNDDLGRWQATLQQAAANVGLKVAAVILGGLALYQPGQEGWLAEAIPAIAELGGGVLMTPEYRPQNPLPIFPPYPAPAVAEVEQVRRALQVVDEAARRYQVPIFLEPLTAFEGRFWRDVATVQRLCEALANPYIGLALDFHNMNITESNPIVTIVRAGQWVRHVHLADNNRRLPGQGHIDFRAGVATLDAIGYDGWYSFECAVTSGSESFTEGDKITDFVTALQRVQSWLAVTATA
jgi:sugar phosphate isomerase/epimerase